MNAEQLKGLQAPLKERYRKDPAAAEQKKKLLELAERYCVVLQTIRNSPPVSASYGA